MPLLLTAFTAVLLTAFDSVLHSLRSSFASVLPLDRCSIDLSSRARRLSSLRLVPSLPTLQDQNPAMTIAFSLLISYLSPFDPLCTAVLLSLLTTDLLS